MQAPNKGKEVRVRAGSASRPSERASATKQQLVAAAVEVLRTQGFAAATTRTIAARAGCNQGLIHYHFGSVVKLLLAALDDVSQRRRQRYEALLASVSGPAELVDLAARIFEEDLDTGDAALLVEMIAGASSTPGLGAEVMARVAPWAEFAGDAIRSAFGDPLIGGLVDAVELSHLVVATYLGLELLSHLDGDRTRAVALFERARQLAPLAGLITQGGRP